MIYSISVSSERMYCSVFDLFLFFALFSDSCILTVAVNLSDSALFAVKKPSWRENVTTHLRSQFLPILRRENQYLFPTCLIFSIQCQRNTILATLVIRQGSEFLFLRWLRKVAPSFFIVFLLNKIYTTQEKTPRIDAGEI